MKKTISAISVLFLFSFVASGCGILPEKEDTPSHFDISGKSTKELMNMAKATDDVSLLRQLSKNENEGVRSDVAKNANLPKDVQKMLTSDKEWIVRNYLGANPNISFSVAETLSNDFDHRVRWTVAKNPNSPEEILMKLVKDENPQVLLKLVSNTGLSEAVLVKAAETMVDTVAVEILKRDNIPESVMTALRNRNEQKIKDALEKKLPSIPDAFQ